MKSWPSLLTSNRIDNQQRKVCKSIVSHIYVGNPYLNDMNLMWNYTIRSTNPSWFKLKREMDSINGDYESKEELNRIIKEFRD